ncbi:carbon-nitrogen hydrolase family protein [uncultured Eudoraea sp.]|uniref:carbon-nitrogen hydrolase family protein n=1 Tax=uncultured Eudoraea sp. TaxID=1035614 RepID=UPI0026141587|nr:carbon-nitrogen hydrolase family protein [uncultured Eudoraea sp.]
MNNHLKLALAQISPVWLDKMGTIAKIEDVIHNAAKEKAELLIFGEGILPGYPFWLAYTDGASWNLEVNKEIHAHYMRNAIQIEKGDLNTICDLAGKYKLSIYLGIIERAQDRGGHSLYCSLVYIDSKGEVKSVHRKLQPTYDERLTWAPGDGNGLKTHRLKQFTVGGLNCWENWMPLVRASMYGLGENLHIAVWPGSDHNTRDITRFIARESRSFVVSVSSLMEKKDIPDNIPHSGLLIDKMPEILANGGSCIAGPDGEWIMEPVVGKEGLIFQTIDFNRVYEERQNFDPSGHYSRPDVTKLILNRQRQSTIDLND